jgi:hypothetical protein
VSLNSYRVSKKGDGVEDSEGVELGVAPTGAGVPEGVRVPVGDAGLEGDSEGYAD